jgi:hypothetical protein
MNLFSNRPAMREDESDSFSIKTETISGRFYTHQINTGFQKGSLLFRSPEYRPSSHSFYMNYGTIIENNPFNVLPIELPFLKTDWSRSKRQLCEMFGCGGFDFNQFRDYEAIRFQYHVISEMIDVNLLNIAKIVYFDEDKDNISNYLTQFLKYERVNFEVDTIGSLYYIKLLNHAPINNIGTKDLFKLTQYIRNENKKIEKMKNTKKNLELKRELEIKENILKLARMDKRIQIDQNSMLNKSLKKSIFMKINTIFNN